MSANKIFTAKNEITGIKSRPNVIIAYGEGKREEAMSLSDMLSREEINVIPHEKGDIFENTCLFGDMHMMVVRDGGLSAPEFGLIEELRKMSPFSPFPTAATRYTAQWLLQRAQTPA